MLLQDLVNTALPFVIFKPPHSGKLHILQQQNDKLFTTVDLAEPGFYFVPFDFDKHPIVLFPENKIEKQAFLVRDFSFDKNNKSQILTPEIDSYQKENHLKNVEKAIKLIVQNDIEKIIISRLQKVSFNSFNPFNAVLKLMQAYDESYVYYWHHPKAGSWMGATPEILINSTHNHIETIALAGTLPITSAEPVAWQMKEIKEQQIVTDYIKKTVSKYTDNLQVSLPETIYQGKLAHIRTKIEATVSSDQLQNLIFDLHPTPAVCGLPTQQAKVLIEQIENYDRKYYTGFLGFKNKHTTDFYVNLRNMSIHQNYLNLYIGGGIIKDSHPEKEWQETLLKSKVLLSVIN